MTVFEVLYDLAIRIQVDGGLTKLTAHHTKKMDEAVGKVRTSLLTSVMPGENAVSNWHLTRVFLRNLVNRAQPPATDQDIISLLSQVERSFNNDIDRINSLLDIADNCFKTNKIRSILPAIEMFTSKDNYKSLGGLNYIDWISARRTYWSSQALQDLNSEEMISDLEILFKNKETKIHGVGFALAANFFADIGLSCFVKPDLHVLPIINMLQLRNGEEMAFCGLIKIAQKEAPIIDNNESFDWLRGFMPRHLDRIIYLIGSDNFGLSGVKNKRQAPKRRDLIRDSIIQAGIVYSRYQ